LKKKKYVLCLSCLESKQSEPFLWAEDVLKTNIALYSYPSLHPVRPKIFFSILQFRLYNEERAFFGQWLLSMFPCTQLKATTVVH